MSDGSIIVPATASALYAAVLLAIVGVIAFGAVLLRTG